MSNVTGIRQAPIGTSTDNTISQLTALPLINIDGLDTTSAGVLYDVSSTTYNFYRQYNQNTGVFDFAFIKVAGIVTIPIGNTQGFVSSPVLPSASFASVTSGQTAAITLMDRPAFLLTISLSTGEAAVIFCNRASSSVTIMSDPADVFQATNTPDSGKLGVFKSSSSDTVSFVSNLGVTVSVEVFSTYASIASTTVWS